MKKKITRNIICINLFLITIYTKASEACYSILSSETYYIVQNNIYISEDYYTAFSRDAIFCSIIPANYTTAYKSDS